MGWSDQSRPLMSNDSTLLPRQARFVDEYLCFPEQEMLTDGHFERAGSLTTCDQMAQ